MQSSNGRVATCDLQRPILFVRAKAVVDAQHGRTAVVAPAVQRHERLRVLQGVGAASIEGNTGEMTEA